jgi:uncharacterized protein (TIGR02996 family)
MGDEGAFLQAIVKAPADDGPRLVYADWLDERGDGHRAAFLRADAALRYSDGCDPGYLAALDGWVRARDAVSADWVDTLGPRVNGLLLPTVLADLVAAGKWKAASDLDTVACPSWFLYPYSLDLMRGETANVCERLRWVGAADPNQPPGDLDPRLAVLIGDEGIGSDAPFALDYRATFGRPRVLRLRWVTWGEPAGGRWVEIAPDFRAFHRLSAGSPAIG